MLHSGLEESHSVVIVFIQLFKVVQNQEIRSGRFQTFGRQTSL
jgi:hypothetical protein